MDRRTVWAILIMMVIAITPALFIKRPAPKAGPAAGAGDSTAPAPSPTPTPSAAPAPGPADSGRPDTGSAVPRRASEDTVRVSSPLYTFGFSTLGGRMVEASLARYRSMDPAE